MSGFGLVYLGLTPQQQPGSYRGGDDHDEMSVALVEDTGAGKKSGNLTNQFCKCMGT